MNKIICNSVDYVLATEVESMTQTEVILRDGAVWHRLEATEKPVYGSDIKQQDAGPVNEETVSLQIRFNTAPQLRTHIAYHFILRLATDAETFHVGSPPYPARLEISSDRLFDNLSFTATSPA